MTKERRLDRLRELGLYKGGDDDDDEAMGTGMEEVEGGEGVIAEDGAVVGERQSWREKQRSK